MFTWICIFGIVLFHAFGPSAVLAVKPHYTCEEFETGARFNVYEILDFMWKIVYFWGNTTEVYPISFSLPGKERIDTFRQVVDATYPNLGVEWHKAALIMEPRHHVQVLMLYAGTPGAFRGVVRIEQRDKVRPQPIPLIKFADVRMKIVDRVMGMMCCEDLTKYALKRLYEVPETEAECEAAAALLGFTEPGGRSHLYVANLTRRVDDEL